MKTLAFYLLFLTAAAGASPRIVVHGHRGAAALRPENTIPSFEEAIRGGADFIEMDVAVTSDNVLVISHDPVVNLEICTGVGGRRPIHELTFEQVRQYDCGSLTRKAFPRQTPVPGARIPTLDEVLDLAKSSAIKFNIEIKSSPDWHNYTLPPDELSRAVVGAVRKHKLAKRVLLQSFDFRVVKAVRAIAPDLDVAALYGPGDRTFTDVARETGARTVTPLHTLVTPEKLKAAHDAGIRVIPWTADKQEDWDRLIDMGVDGIITNDPGALVRHLKTRGKR
jgi:glycerophosphoryl diester phosphodiesterase